MTKERFNMFQDNSLYNTPIREGAELTDAEFYAGYHYYYDWDGLFIGPESREFECCTCHPLKRKLKNES